MTGIPFNLCPRCGGRQVDYKNDRYWLCADCGFALFNNIACAVGLIIEAEDTGRVLFEVRALEPKKGSLALPGGFTDADESLEESAMRECEEETSLRPLSVSYLCSFPNTYEYKGVIYKTCDSFFTAHMPFTREADIMERLSAQQSEVVSFSFERLADSSDIDRIKPAFQSTCRALEFWLKKRHGS